MIQNKIYQEQIDIKAKMESYHVKRYHFGKSSKNSMPIGNGDITLNVWVEENGDLCFYIGKSDSWSEATRLLKVGKVRVKFNPNPFIRENSFLQVLDLYAGEMIIRTGSKDNQITIKIWVDANHPVIRLEASGKKEYTMEVVSEIWRNQEIEMSKATSHSYRGLLGNPDLILKESADVSEQTKNGIIWYHRNIFSYFEEILKSQHIKGYGLQQDPYLFRTFGVFMEGKQFAVKNHQTLESETPSKIFSIALYPYTAQTETIEQWKKQLFLKVEEIHRMNVYETKRKHQYWWSKFWNKSYLFISGDETATTVTRGYIMQRYLQAIQGRGKYPIKFNGGSITYDSETDYPIQASVNADYRKWGSCYWFQNTRHLYWNMLAAGDFDLMLPLFDMYYNMLEIQKKITRQYYGHDGAFFPETVNFFGLYAPEDFGWNNEGEESENEYVRYYWQGGLELSAMMLKYHEYTNDDQLLRQKIIPVVEEVLQFYTQHYARNAKGVLEITPSHALETYWEHVKNPVDVIAGLRCVVSALLTIPERLTTIEEREKWAILYQTIPNIPIGQEGEHSYIKPAHEYEDKRHNTENPELYPVFPYNLYGVGKENIELAIHTYERRVGRENFCWRQNGIHAAYLGLVNEAKQSVIEHFENVESEDMFPGYWAKGFDWTPDLDNGGSAMMALQAMILQCNTNGKLFPLPAWPKEWNVEFQLYIPNHKRVAGGYFDGEMRYFNIVQEE